MEMYKGLGRCVVLFRPALEGVVGVVCICLCDGVVLGISVSDTNICVFVKR